MSHQEPSGPELDGVVAAADAVGLPYVVIGGFSVIANGFVRATKDSDLLVPDGAAADSAILRFLERIEATRLSDDQILTEDEVMAAEEACRPSSPLCAASSASSVSPGARRTVAISKNLRPSTVISLWTRSRASIADGLLRQPIATS